MRRSRKRETRKQKLSRKKRERKRLNVRLSDVKDSVKDKMLLLQGLADIKNSGKIEKILEKNIRVKLRKLFKKMNKIQRKLLVKSTKPKIVRRRISADDLFDQRVDAIADAAEILRRRVRTRGKKKVKADGRLVLTFDETVGTETVLQMIDDMIEMVGEDTGLFPKFQYTFKVELVSDDGRTITRTINIPIFFDDPILAFEQLLQKAEVTYGRKADELKRVLWVKMQAEGLDIEFKESQDFLNSLLAFGTISDRKYQSKCLMSLSVKSRVCIYWTYLVIEGLIKPTRGKKAENFDRYVGLRLKAETSKLRKMVRAGNLSEFLTYKSAKNNKPYYLYTHNSQLFHKYHPNGDIEILDNDEMADDQKCFYHKGIHVAPSEGRRLKSKIKVKHECLRILDPIEQCTSQRVRTEKLHFYDIESYAGGEFGLLCSVTEGPNGFVGNHFYKLDNFAQYIDGMAVKANKKTNKKGKTTLHNFYAHNATRYDAIYIYQPLGKICPLTSISTGGNSLKCFRYGLNIMFKDSLLMIQGSLAKLAKEVFKIKIKASELPEGQNYYNYPSDHYITGKEVFPYLFYSKDNIDYIGEVPDWEYFGHSSTSDEERKECRERCYNEHLKYKKKFNLRKYNEYYCYLDCILGYKMIKKYGELNTHHPEIKCSPRVIQNVKNTLFPYTQKKKKDGTKKAFKPVDLSKYPEFKGINMENEADKRTRFFEFARKRIYHNPLNSVTKSGETMSRFKKLYNVYDFIGIQDQYEELEKGGYGGGITDVYKKSFVHPQKDKIFEMFNKIGGQEEFNEYMNNLVKTQDLDSRLHKDDINSSYPQVMRNRNVPIECVGHTGIFGKYYYSENAARFRNDSGCLSKDAKAEPLQIDKDSDLLKEEDNGIVYIKDNKDEMDSFNQNLKILLFTESGVVKLDDLIIDHYHYMITYSYKDPKFIPNIYIHKDDKFQGCQNGAEKMVWGSVLKQAIREHLKNRTEHHGCDSRFDYLHVYGFLRFKAEPAFKSYITYLYDQRSLIKAEISTETDEEKLGILEVKSKALKDRMNCLYGKFGQKIFPETIMCYYEEYKHILNTRADDIVEIKELNGYDGTEKTQFLISLINEEGGDGSIGKLRYIASYITACARVNLFDMIYSAGVKNVYYVDTDSCFYTGNRIDKIDPSKLGWRDSEICENVESNNIIMTGLMCNAPKFYGSQGFKKKKNGDWVKMEDKLKSKGIKHGLLKYSDYEALNSGKLEFIGVDCINFIKRFTEGYVEPHLQPKKVKCVYSKRQFQGNNSTMNEGEVHAGTPKP